MEQRTATSNNVLPLPPELEGRGGQAIRHSPYLIPVTPVTQATYIFPTACHNDTQTSLPYQLSCSIRTDTTHRNSGWGDSLPEDSLGPAIPWNQRLGRLLARRLSADSRHMLITPDTR